MRDVVFITGAFKYLTTDESERALDILLDALVKLDLDWLTHHPETPSIYKSGIRYIREEGTEEWLTIPEIMREGGGDCEDLACWRAAELIFTRADPAAKPIKRHHLIPSEDDGRPFLLYHITVQRGDGTEEDPSRKLGMGHEVPPQYRSLEGLDYELAKLGQMLLNAARKGNPVAKEQILALCRAAQRGHPASVQAVGLLQEVRAMMRTARVG
jgi:hypothetical protein